MENIKLLIFFLIASANCKIPDYIHRCAKNDPKLTTCIKNTINALRPKLKAGIPELDIPPIEPFHLRPLQIHLGEKGANVTDINVWGASDFNILDLSANLATNLFTYWVNIPKLTLKGAYEVDTNILFLNIQGKGPIIIDIHNYKFNCSMKGNEIQKNNEVYLKFDKMTCEIGFEGASVKLENLFNGNQLLGKVTNGVINDNVGAFFNEIKPIIEDELSNVFTNIANQITLRFNYRELFL